MTFESVIMAYFNIDSETLQSKTIYYAEDETYEYKPRGFEEVEYPEYPYSEVVGFTENSDGTLTLTANVVFLMRVIPRYMPTRLWFVHWRMEAYSMCLTELYRLRTITEKHGIPLV